MDKTKRNITIILILMGILFFAFAGDIFSLVNPSPGASLIPNPTNPTAIYTLTTNANTYLCDAEECIVSGVVNFDKLATTGSNVPAVSNGVNGYCCTEGTKSVCSNTPHLCSTAQRLYGGNFNFCPIRGGQTDTTFAYCSGVSNIITSDTVLTNEETDEVKLYNGNSVTFQPKDLSGTPITNFQIRVKKYDLSCNNLISSGDACNSALINTVQCKPSTGCPSGYTLRDPLSVVCGGQCYNSGTGSCVNKIIDNTKYVKCDSQLVLSSGASCGKFGTNLYTAPTGQQCIVSGSNNVGSVKCAGNCNPGDRTGTTGQNTYQECKISGSCYALISQTCLTGLVYDDSVKACVIPSEQRCNSIFDTVCTSNKEIKTCSSFLTGFKWNNPAPCPGELGCSSGQCGCDGISEVRTTDLKCLDNTNYLEYSKDPTNVNSCYKYRNLGNHCSSTTDSRNTRLETCSSNQCTLTNDAYTSSSAQLVNTKCIGNSIYKTMQYNDGSKAFFRWELKTDATNANNGACLSQYICSEESGQARCTIGGDYINLLFNQTIGVNDKINGIKIALSPKVPNYANIRIYAYLIQNGDTKASIPGSILTDSNGEATLDFDYSSSTPTKVTLNIYAGSPTSIYNTAKEITISKKLKVLLNCPVSINVNRQVICTYRFADAQFPTQNLQIPVTAKITVTDGNDNEITSTSTTSSITFTPTLLGTATVMITGSADGYMSTTDAPATITIDPINYAPQITIDNEDFDKYASSGVTTGTHTLGISVDESGQQADIYKVVAELVSPTQRLNEGTILVLTKGSSGVWTGSGSFPTAGQTYTLHIKSIEFSDRTIFPLLDVSYKITTVATNTQDNAQINFLLYGAIGFGILTVIVVIVLIIINRRKK